MRPCRVHHYTIHPGIDLLFLRTTQIHSINTDFYFLTNLPVIGTVSSETVQITRNVAKSSSKHNFGSQQEKTRSKMKKNFIVNFVEDNFRR